MELTSVAEFARDITNHFGWQIEPIPEGKHRDLERFLRSRVAPTENSAHRARTPRIERAAMRSETFRRRSGRLERANIRPVGLLIMRIDCEQRSAARIARAVRVNTRTQSQQNTTSTVLAPPAHYNLRSGFLTHSVYSKVIRV